MLTEVISFGGRWKNVRAIIAERLRRQQNFERRPTDVRLKAESEAKTILVQIKVKQRDTREVVKIDNPGQPNHGKEVKNKNYGKFVYETFDSLELEQATAEEVYAAVKEGILRATKK